MKQEAAITACRLVNILQMLRRGPEKTTQRGRNVPLRDPHGLSHPIHISLSHIRKIITVSLSAMSLSSRPSLCYLFSISSPSRELSVEAAAWGGRFVWNAGVLLRGLDQSALQWFLLFGVCVFPEKPLVCRLPPVLSLKHTHARINTQICIFDVNLCESSVLASSQRQHWISGSELLSPKINHKTWEHCTKPNVIITMTDFLDYGEAGQKWSDWSASFFIDELKTFFVAHFSFAWLSS